MSGKLQMKKATTTAPVRQETTELKPAFKYRSLQVCQAIVLFVKQNQVQNSEISEIQKQISNMPCLS